MTQTLNDIDPKTVKLIDPTGKEVTELPVDGEGTWTVDPTTGEVTFTPEDGFTDDPTPVKYTVEDTTGNKSNPAEVTVDYPQNPPVAEDDKETGKTGEPVKVDVLGNDTDPEDDIDPKTVKLIDPTGKEVTELPVDGEGTWTVDPTTGEVTFTPEDGFTDDPTPVKYTVEDTTGNKSNPAEVTVDYPQNPPVAEDDKETGKTGEPVKVDVLGNDTDPEDDIDPKTVKLIDPTGKEVTELPVDGEGTWTVDPTTGEVTFTPEDGFTDDPTPVKYTVEDTTGNKSNPAEVTVDYPPKVKIVAKDDEAVEGVDNALEFTVSQNEVNNKDTIVKVKPTGNSTVEPEDIVSIVYTDGNGNEKTLNTPEQIEDFFESGVNVQIAKGKTETPIKITVKDDESYEVSEDLVLEISEPKNASLSDEIEATGVINDEDDGNPKTPTDTKDGDKPKLTVGDAEAVEGDDLVHKVKVNGESETDITYKFELKDGSAEEGKDYDNTPTFSNGVELNDDGTITVPAGTTEFTVTYPTTDDTEKEDKETTTLTIGNSTGTGTIVDNDKLTINLKATDDVAIEGGVDSDGSDKDSKLVFEVSQTLKSSKATTAIIKLDLGEAEVEDVEAIVYKDALGTETTYTVADLQAGVEVEIPAGSDAKPTFTFTAKDDDIYEVSEELKLTMSDVENAELGTSEATGVINDEDDGNPKTPTDTKDGDKPVVNLVSTDAVAVEGGQSGDASTDNQLVYTVKQDGESEKTTKATVKLDLNEVEAEDIESITLTKADGSTQTVTVDELKVGVEVEIPAGTTADKMPKFTIIAKDDDIYEVSEELKLTMSDVENATLGTSEATGVINDEDDGNPKTPTDTKDGDKPKLTVGDAEAVEGDDLVHKVKVNGESETDITYKFELKDGSAEEGKDYDNTPTFSNGVELNDDGTITVPAGTTEFTVTYPTTDDTEKEDKETTTLTIGNSTGTGTIVDNDKLTINLKATDDVAIEGGVDSDGSDKDSKLVFEVSQTLKSSKATTAIIKLDLGEAEVEDVEAIVYKDALGTETTYTVADLQAGVEVEIPAGSDAKPTFTFTAKDDDIYEVSEELKLTMSDVENAELGTSEATGVINDEDDGNPKTPTDTKDGDKPVVNLVSTDAVAVEGGQSGDASTDNQLVYTVKQDGESEKTTKATVKLDLNEVEAEDIESITLTKADGSTQTVTVDELKVGVEVEIPAGTTADKMPKFTIIAKDDDIYEVSEELKLTMSDVENATLGTSEATGVINDEDDGNPKTPTDTKDGDKPVVNLVSTDAVAVEGGQSGDASTDNQLVYTVKQDGESEKTTKATVKLDLNEVEAEDIESITLTKADGSTQTVTVDELKVGVEVEIPAGTTADKMPKFTIIAKDDDIYEVSEELKLTMSDVENATLGTSEATGVINDEDDGNPKTPTDTKDGDKPVVNLVSTDAVAVEGGQSGDASTDNQLVYTVKQDGESEKTTKATVKLDLNEVEAEDIESITLTKADGSTQTVTVDELKVGVEVEIPAGTTADKMPKFTIIAKDDDIYEVSEELKLTMSDVENATLGTSEATGVINDEDDGNPKTPTDTKDGDKPVINIAAVAADVEENAGYATFKLTKVGESEVDGKVKVQLNNGTGADGTEDDDFSGPLQYKDTDGNWQDVPADGFIPVGKDTAEIELRVPVEDDEIEETEKFNVTIEETEKLTKGTDKADGSITDEDEDDDGTSDDQPVINIAAVAADVEENAGYATFKLTKVGESEVDGKVKVQLNNGTGADGTEDDDFSGPLQYKDTDGNWQDVPADGFIPVGKDTAEIELRVPVEDDEIFEETEKFNVTIEETEKLTKGTDKADGSITDEDEDDDGTSDDQPVINIAAVAADVEENAGYATFKLTKVGESEVDGKVKVQLNNGTGADGTEDDDFSGPLQYKDTDGNWQDVPADGFIPVGKDTAEIELRVPVEDDEIFEETEKFNVTIEETEKLTKGTDKADGSITDEDEDDDGTSDDQPVINIAAVAADVEENAYATFKLTKVGESEVDGKVKVQLNNGTGADGTEDDDFSGPLQYKDTDGNWQDVPADGFIPVGKDTAEIELRVPVEDDEIFEETEKFNVTIEETEKLTKGTDKADGSITDEDEDDDGTSDDQPVINIAAVAADVEENAGYATFKLTKVGESEVDGKVKVQLNNGTGADGTEDDDFSGPLQYKDTDGNWQDVPADGFIPVGKDTAEIELRVPVEDDEIFEETEKFNVTIEETEKLTKGTDKADGSITDEDEDDDGTSDDQPVINIAAVAADVEENAGYATFKLTKVGESEVDGKVKVQLNNGTGADGTEDDDFSGPLQYKDTDGNWQDVPADGFIPVGKDTAEIELRVPVEDDEIFEETEKFNVTIEETEKLTKGTDKADGSITDEDEDDDGTSDDQPVINIAAVAADVEENAGYATFKLTKVGESEVDGKVKVQLNNGTGADGTEDDDFSGPLQYKDTDGNWQDVPADGFIPVGKDTAEIELRVPVEDDEIFEETEKFNVTIEETEKLTKGTDKADGSITDEDEDDDGTSDDQPVINIAAVAADVEENAGYATFKLTKVGESEVDGKVKVQLNNGTGADGTEDDDFSGPLQYKDTDGNWQDVPADGFIPVGKDTAEIELRVPVEDDEIFEETEKFNVTIEETEKLTKGTDKADGSITDEDEDDDGTSDDQPVINIAAVAADVEENAGYATFKLTKVGESEVDGKVKVQLNNGTGADGTEDDDFSGPLQYKDTDGNWQDVPADGFIPVGKDTAEIELRVPVEDDEIFEETEKFNVTIEETEKLTKGTDKADGSITDEDEDDDGTSDDQPVINIAAVAADVEENAGYATFKLTKVGESEVDGKVKVQLNNGTGADGTEDDDFSGPLQYKDTDGNWQDVPADGFIPVGKDTAEIELRVPVEDDEIFEETEKFNVTIEETEKLTKGTDKADGSITDEDEDDDGTSDDQPVINIAAVAADVEENAGYATFKLTKVGESEVDGKVKVQLNNGTGADGTEDDDFSGPLQYKDTDGNWQDVPADGFIPVGKDTAEIELRVPVEDDEIFEETEKFNVTIEETEKLTKGTDKADGSITDEDEDDDGTSDDQPVINIAAVAADVEENAGYATFKLTKVGESEVDGKVKVQLNNGTGADGTEDDDFSGPLQYKDTDGNWQDVPADGFIPVGKDTAEIELRVPVEDDEIFEETEKFNVTIEETEKLTKGTDKADGSITDEDEDDDGTSDDQPVINIAAVAADVEENAGYATFKLTKVGESEVDGKVKVQLNNGTGADGTEDDDFSGPLQYKDTDGNWQDVPADGFIPVGKDTAEIELRVPVEDDEIFEETEKFNVTIEETEKLTKGTDKADGSITDEDEDDDGTSDDQPVINIAAVAADVEENAGYATFKLTKVGESEVDGKVKVQLNNGTGADGTEDDDFSGPLQYKDTDGNWQDVPADGFIPVGKDTAEIELRVPVEDDEIFEETEKFNVTIEETEKLTKGTDKADGSITDEDEDDDGTSDDQPSLTINDVEVTETDEDQTVTFTVTQSNVSELDTTVDVAIEHVDTTSGDVKTTVTQVIIRAGETTATIDVTVVGDDFWEPTETYNVKLSNANNASIADDTGVGTIINDDITANDDASTAVEAGGLNSSRPGSSATGNVLNGGGNDVADDPTNAHATVTAIRKGDTEGSGDAGTVGSALVGTYGTLTINTDGSYTYVVDNANEDVQELNVGDTLTESFNYTMSDGTLSDDAVLEITIDGDNDAPTVLEITSTRVSEEGLAGGIKDNLSYNNEDDLVAASINDAVNNNPDVQAAATIAEAAANAAAAANKAYRENTDDSLDAQLKADAETKSSEARVAAKALSDAKEAALPDAIANAYVNKDDTTNEKVATGKITFTDVDNFDAGNFKIIPDDVDITVQGNDVQWTWNEGAGTLQGTVVLDGSTTPIDVMKIVLGTPTGPDADGKFEADYTVTLQHAIDHENNLGDNGNPSDDQNDEDILELNFKTVVNDGVDDSAAANLTVTIEDDRPKVAEGKTSILLEPLTSNVQIIVDTSGSMSANSGVKDDFVVFDSLGNLITLPADQTADIYTTGVSIHNARGVQLYEYDGNVIDFGYGVSQNYYGYATTAGGTYYYIDPANGAATIGEVATYRTGGKIYDANTNEELGDAIVYNNLTNATYKATYQTDDEGNFLNEGDIVTVERGLTRLEVTQQAIMDMISAYEEAGSAYSSRFQLVEFATEAFDVEGSLWLTGNEARQNLFKFVAGGSTNYDAALSKAIELYDNAGKIADADVNTTYFMTDGTPTAALTKYPYDYANEDLGGTVNHTASGDLGIQSGEEQAWIDFLVANKIKSYAYAMGNGAPVDELHPVAHDGTTGDTDPNGIGKMQGVEVDFSTLKDELLSSIPTPKSPDRDLIKGDDPSFDGGMGADGGDFVSVTVGGVTYTFDAEANTITASDGSAVVVTNTPGENGANTYNPDEHLLTATSTTGGVFSIHFADGTKTVTNEDGSTSEVAYTKGLYDYQTAGTVDGYKESIYFNVRDNDGDLVAAEQLIDVYRLKAKEDNVLTSQDINNMKLDVATLMANDTTRLSTQFKQAEKPANGLTLLNGVDGNAMDGTTGVQIDTSQDSIAVSGDGKFGYGIIDGTNSSDTTIVNVEHKVNTSSAGAVGIKGTRSNDVIIGNDEDEWFSGYSGDDVIQGGGGSDRLYGHKGDDILIFDQQDARLLGGKGEDTIRLDGAELDLDISGFLLAKDSADLKDIEIIDLFDDKSHTLDISADTVKKMTDSDNELIINADKSDKITLTGFVEADNSGKAGYNLYELDGAKVYLDIDNTPTL
ncbi:Calx-beta domain-containing protein [Psychrobacter sp. HD31]|uniref:Calx-beta domain-containing protein n=1 Tax=Psychrobacter sp. HD31 TaxID=3112003 RepID=UPI003DA634E6